MIEASRVRFGYHLSQEIVAVREVPRRRSAVRRSARPTISTVAHGIVTIDCRSYTCVFLLNHPTLGINKVDSPQRAAVINPGVAVRPIIEGDSRLSMQSIPGIRRSGRAGANVRFGKGPSVQVSRRSGVVGIARRV